MPWSPTFLTSAFSSQIHTQSPRWVPSSALFPWIGQSTMLRVSLYQVIKMCCNSCPKISFELILSFLLRLSLIFQSNSRRIKPQYCVTVEVHKSGCTWTKQWFSKTEIQHSLNPSKSSNIIDVETPNDKGFPDWGLGKRKTKKALVFWSRISWVTGLIEWTHITWGFTILTYTIFIGNSNILKVLQTYWLLSPQV